MAKIIITGGLGYIGTQLCELYSKEIKENGHDITIIDNRFLPERVAQLKAWGMKFIEGDITDRRFISEIVKDADIIYHLAGITDVAYTNKDMEFTAEKNALIRLTGTHGSRNIIDAMPQTAKIVFPSSHVLFEGLSYQVFDLDENHKPEPRLAYATSKWETEEDLKNSGKNYIICRLGTNYGIGPSMRLKIVANTFAKLAAQGKTISMFSGGTNFKSLVSVKDTARCLKFLGENPSINKEIFNCINENLRIVEIAEICKKFNPNTNITTTNDPIPNEGYTLSNKKLLSTGFEFKYNVHDSIKEMIDSWKTH
ncbi:NAD(P)-dependent oxidoreductase [Candidatus Pacearchaeota archaeon]|nr:NAD(P)-dependent oxidoreductase [Candidatus Pacearchaeota archaeon]